MEIQEIKEKVNKEKLKNVQEWSVHKLWNIKENHRISLKDTKSYAFNRKL